MYIRLEDNGTVAHCVKGNEKGVVFTKQAIPVGAMFELLKKSKLLEVYHL